jgi:hypothetical protein
MVNGAKKYQAWGYLLWCKDRIKPVLQSFQDDFS